MLQKACFLSQGLFRSAKPVVSCNPLALKANLLKDFYCMKNQEDCDGLEPQRCEDIKAIVAPGID